MKVLVLGLVCLVWLQSSCSAPKWTCRKSGVFCTDDSDTHKEYDFLDLELVLNALELKRQAGHPQERPKDYNKTDPPSVLWAVMAALRGIYVLWMFQFFCSWYMEADNDDHLDCSSTSEDNGGLSSADEDSTEAITVESDVIIFDEDDAEMVRDVVQVMLDVVSVAEKLVEDVAAISLADMQVGDGLFPLHKVPSVDRPIDFTDSDQVMRVDDDGENVAECSSALSESSHSMDAADRVLLMSRLEREFLMRNNDNPPDEIALPDRPKKTLEEINEIWTEEKVPYLRQIPKVRFRQQVEVKTFLVRRPMASYDPKKGPSEMTRVEPLKREGEFVEVGLLPTKKSLKHRLLKGVTRLGRTFRRG